MPTSRETIQSWQRASRFILLASLILTACGRRGEVEESQEGGATTGTGDAGAADHEVRAEATGGVDPGPRVAAIAPVEIRRAESDNVPFDGWQLFDGDSSTRLTPSAEGTRLQVRLGRTARVESIALWVSGPMAVELQGVRSATTVSQPGVSQRWPSGGARWERIELPSPLDTDQVDLTLQSLAPDSSVGEVEVFALVPADVLPSGTSLTEGLLSGTIRGASVFRSRRHTLTVSAPSIAADRDSNLETFEVTVDPRSIDRAFIVYRLDGLAHWSAVRRSLNGAPARGGDEPVASTDGHTHIEEIPPAGLRRGTNTLRFLPVRPGDARGYSIADLRVVTIPRTLDPEVPSGALGDLTDGSPVTGFIARRELHPSAPVQWPFGSTRQPQSLTIHLAQPFRGTLAISSMRGETASTHTVAMDARTAGWHRFRLDDVLPPGEAVRIEARVTGDTVGLISEVFVLSSALPSRVTPRLTITSPRAGECLGAHARVRGFVAAIPFRTVTIQAGTHNHGAVVDSSGGFEVPIELPERDGPIQVTARDATGQAATQTVAIERCPPVAPVLNRPSEIREDHGAPFGQWVQPDQPSILTFGGVKLEIPEGAVERPTRVTVRPLDASQVASLDPGLRNASPDGRAFRFGPNHLHFRRPIKVTLPFDRTRIGNGRSEGDLQAFYFDEGTRRWRSVRRIAGAHAGLLTSTTDHFTDYIAGTIATPDSPQASALDANSIRSFPMANPTDGLQTIAPPGANNRGTANVQLPIELPPGRQGMEPSLALVYNSEHMNGPLGVGWDLPTPKIEIDTRFGAARYGADEPVYLLDGEPLVRVTSGSCGVAGATCYRRRTEGSFDYIARIGTGTTDYRWEIRDRNGVRHDYGGDGAVLASPDTGNIFRWSLKRSRDLFGNEVRYSYQLQGGQITGTNGPSLNYGAQYLSSIEYTAHVGTSGGDDLAPAFRVDLVWVKRDGKTGFVISSARGGFDHRIVHRLGSIAVSAGARQIRRYDFDYEADPTGTKRRLKSMSLFGENNALFHTHRFDYYGPGSDGIREGFSAPQDFATVPPTATGSYSPVDNLVGLVEGSRVSSMSRAVDLSGGGNLFGGIGFGACFPHVGVTGGGSFSASRQLRHFVDVDGNGLPDLIDTNGTVLLAKWNAARTGLTFESTSIGAEASLGATNSASVSLSLGAHAPNETGAVSVDYVHNWTDAPEIFVDSDGDGRPDLVSGPHERTGGGTELDVRRNPFSYPTTASRFGNGTTEAADHHLGAFVVPPRERIETNEVENLRQSAHHIDTLVRWASDCSGTFTVTGAINIVNAAGVPAATGSGDGVEAVIYLVKGAGRLGTTPSADTPVWRRVIRPGDAPCTPTYTAPGMEGLCGTGLQLTLKPNDRLYFRVHARADAAGDHTAWSPAIQWARDGNCGNGVSPSDVPLAWNFSTDFRATDPDLVGWVAPFGGFAHLAGTIHRDDPSEEVTVRVLRRRRDAGLLDTIFGPVAGVFLTTTDMLDMLAAVEGDPSAGVQTEVVREWTLDAADGTDVLLEAELGDIERDDQFVFSVKLPKDADPGTVQWRPLVTYDTVTTSSGSDPEKLRGVLWDECEDRLGVPSCPLQEASSDTHGRIWQPRLMVERRAEAAIGSRFIDEPDPYPLRLQHSLLGEYRNWSVGAWRGPINRFDEWFVQPEALHEVLRDIGPYLHGDNGAWLPHVALTRSSEGLVPRRFLPGGPLVGDTVAGPLWATNTNDVYIRAGQVRPGRVSLIEIDSQGNTSVTAIPGYEDAFAPGLRSSVGHNGGAGGSIPGASASGNTGTSDTSLEFIDFDGDGRPDSLHRRIPAIGSGSTDTLLEVGLQRARLVGTDIDRRFEFVTPAPVLASGSIRHTETTHRRYGFKPGSAASVMMENRGSVASLLMTLASVPSISVDDSTAFTDIDLVDINGDGLVDSVQSSQEVYDTHSQTRFRYQLNLGGYFGPQTDLVFNAREDVPPGPGNGALSYELSTSESIAVGHAGLGGGPTFTRRRTLLQMIDMNGDNLPDRLWKDDPSPGKPGGFFVQYNCGDTFTDAREWQAGAWTDLGLEPILGEWSDLGLASQWDALNYSNGTNWGIGFGTGPIPIPIPPIVCIVAEPSAQLGATGDDSRVQIMDINGDGLPDHVYFRASDGHVYARLNQLGRLNLLKTVHNPLGGSFSLEYGLRGNDVRTTATGRVDMPRRMWALTAVTRNDAHGRSYRTRFEYENGYYDRTEREDYGFARVITTREDDSRIITDYANQSYEQHGRVAATRELDPLGRWIASESHGYTRYTSTAIPWIFAPETKVVRCVHEAQAVLSNPETAPPGICRETRHVFEATSDPTTMDPVSYTLKRTEERGEEVTGTDTKADDVDIEVTWSSNATTNQLRPTAVVTRVPNATHTGVILQERTATYLAKGELHTLFDRVIGGRDPATGALYPNTSSVGSTTTYTHDSYGNIQTATDQTGLTVSYDYDDASKTHRRFTFDSLGHSSYTIVDAAYGLPTQTHDTNGQYIDWQLDGFGRVARIWGPTDLPSGEPTIQLTYSDLTTTLASTDYRWARTAHKDDARPLNPLETMTLVDGLGRTEQTQREAVAYVFNTPVSGVIASGPVGYDARGRLNRVGEPELFASSLSTSIIAVMPRHETLTTYDSLGRAVDVQEPGGYHTLTRHRVQAETPGGPLRHAITVTDAENHERTTFADANGQTVSVRQFVTLDGSLQPLDTLYHHDRLGRLVAVVDANGNKTTATYDSRGQLLTLKNPDTGLVENRYDLAGELGARITPNLRANGQQIRYVRTHHRLDRIEYPDQVATVLTYGEAGDPYNVAGRLESRTDGSGTVDFRYDELGQVSRETRTLVADGLSGELTTSTLFDYDSFGRMTSLRYPDGETVNYSYDSGGQLYSVSGSRSGVTRSYVSQIRYNALGQRSLIQYGNGVVTDYTLHATTRRLNQVNTTGPGKMPIQRLMFGYDGVGNVATLTNTLSGNRAPLRGGSTGQSFHYDELGQLTSAQGWAEFDDGRRQEYDLAMSYDAIHNITHKIQSSITRDSTGQTTDEDPSATHYLDYDYSNGVHRAAAIGSQGFDYDLDGNRTAVRDGIGGPLLAQLSWNSEDRVTQIENDNGLTTFRYDSSGERTHKVSGSGTTMYSNAYYVVRDETRITKHIYAGSQRIASAFNDNGVPWVDESRRFYHTDHLQSTQWVTDEAGVPTEHLEQLPFGEQWVEESNTSDPVAHRFSAKELDRETGLYYFGSRYYDPRVAQWVSVDPAFAQRLTGERIDQTALLNYTYSDNRPLNMVDPDGEAAIAVDFNPAAGSRFTQENAAQFLRGMNAQARANNSQDTYVMGDFAATNAITPGPLGARINVTRDGQGRVSWDPEQLRQISTIPRRPGHVRVVPIIDFVNVGGGGRRTHSQAINRETAIAVAAGDRRLARNLENTILIATDRGWFNGGNANEIAEFGGRQLYHEMGHLAGLDHLDHNVRANWTNLMIGHPSDSTLTNDQRERFRQLRRRIR